MKANLRLTIESKTGGGNFADEPPVQWAPVRVEWFGVKPLSAREFVQGQAVQSEITHTAECPYFAGAHSEMRLRNSDSSRVFSVKGVVNRNEQNRKLDWMLTEAGVLNG